LAAVSRLAGAGAAESMRILVVDRSAGERDALAALLSSWAEVREVLTVADAGGALQVLHKREVDAVLVDPDLPGIDGFELARILARFAAPPAVVFLADGPSRAIEAFEVGAVDFVLRSAGLGRLAEALGRVQRLVRANAAGAGSGGRPIAAVPAASTLIAVDVVGHGADLPASDVLWIEAQGDYVRAHTPGGSRLVHGPLSRLVADWSRYGLTQIHRSFAVQPTAVSELRRSGKVCTVVVAGRELPVSRRYAQRVKAQLLGDVAPGARQSRARRSGGQSQPAGDAAA
jgi:DNA-binding LytR/AlgR family response regulator